MLHTLATNKIFVYIAMLVVATASWVYVTAAENRIDTFPGKIPVNVTNVPEQLVALPETQEVELRLRADQQTWSLLSVDSFAAQLDLKGLGAGIHEIPVSVATNVPNVQIIEKRPATITVRLEESVSKEVPVRVVVQGTAAEGKAAGEAEPTPKTVLAIGAKSVVGAITEAQAVITLAGESQEVQRAVRLQAFDRSGAEVSGVRFEPGSINVRVPIVQASNARTVGVRVVTIGSTKDGYFVQKITVSPSTVAITGNSEVTAIDTSPIDLTGLSASRTFTVELVFPTGTTSVDRVGNATVTLTIAPLPTSKQVPLTFTIVDIADTVKVDEIDPQSGTVVLAGPADVLAGVDAVSANISVAGLAAGEHTRNVTASNITPPSGVTVSGSPIPSAITVTLSNK